MMVALTSPPLLLHAGGGGGAGDIPRLPHLKIGCSVGQDDSEGESGGDSGGNLNVCQYCQSFSLLNVLL